MVRSRAVDRISLALFLQEIPFLRQVGVHRLRSVDMGEWAFPDEQVAAVRRKLELSLNSHVMTYRRQLYDGVTFGLCELIRAASLDHRGLVCLARAEAHVPDIVFVAYSRPVQLNFQLPESKFLRQ